MKELLTTIAKSSRGLNHPRSYLRYSLEKSSKFYIAPVAIIAAGMLILDGFTTWRTNMK